jgi:hypothetical protein
MGIILLIESFLELPMHFLFSKNQVYLHTNYFKIYDIQKYRQVEVLTNLFENSMVMIFLYFNFTKGEETITVVHILTLVFTLVMLIYFILAEFYFTFFIIEEQSGEVDDYGRTFKVKEEYVKRRNQFTNLEINHLKRRAENNAANVEISDEKSVRENKGELNTKGYLITEKEVDTSN